jgi:quinol monooxygenase YgiN
MFDEASVDLTVKKQAMIFCSCWRKNCQHVSFNMNYSIIKLFALVLVVTSAHSAFSQDKKQMVRLARITVDSAQLKIYNQFLKEEIETSMRVEKGVLFLYAVAEQLNPTHITIFEIYANADAYKAHIKTSHFLKYKTGTKDMVKALQVLEADPLVPGMKVK